MPAKSNVRKGASKPGGFKFKWWMGVGLVAIIAIIGVVIVRFSNASTISQYDQQITNNSRGIPSPQDPTGIGAFQCGGSGFNKFVQGTTAGKFWFCGYFHDNGHIRWVRDNGSNSFTCAEIQRIGQGPNKTRAYFVIDNENSSDLDTGKTVLFIERPCSEGR